MQSNPIQPLIQFRPQFRAALLDLVANCKNTPASDRDIDHARERFRQVAPDHEGEQASALLAFREMTDRPWVGSPAKLDDLDGQSIRDADSALLYLKAKGGRA